MMSALIALNGGNVKQQRRPSDEEAELVTKYKVTFEAIVTIEAEDQAEAVANACLMHNLQQASYRMMDVEEAEE